MRIGFIFVFIVMPLRQINLVKNSANDSPYEKLKYNLYQDVRKVIHIESLI